VKVAVLTRAYDRESWIVYRRSVMSALAARSVETVEFGEGDARPAGADLIWDPGLGQRMVPAALRGAPVPVAVTMHGVPGFYCRPAEYCTGWKERMVLAYYKFRVVRQWRSFRHRVGAVIAASRFEVGELVEVLGLDAQRVHVAPHGTDFETFRPDGERAGCPRPFFLTVGQYTPVKNLDRLFAAYLRLGRDRPDLVAVMPGLDRRIDVRGVRVIGETLSAGALATYYRAAVGFVLPSLHETFGLPVLEAMACGCPVLTANATGCAEVAGDAGLLVDPRSVEEIAGGLRRLADDAELRRRLCRRGVERARQFTWGRSAAAHVKAFEHALAGRS
jgi:glycosyltransferase involved in cell wall biosynthesis